MDNGKAKVKGIGIKNNRAWLRIVFGFAVFFAVIGCVFAWAFYSFDYENEYMLKYGVEVEAEIYKAEHYAETTTFGDGSTTLHEGWKTYYTYTDETGKTYTGVAHNYHGTGMAEVAQSTVGKVIIITIDPNGTSSVPYSKAEIDKPAYTLHLSLAIVATAVLAVCLWLWLYRGFYITSLNRKILKSIGIDSVRIVYGGARIRFEELDILEQSNGFASRINRDRITVGEVTGTFGLFIKRVKVRYTDERNECREKWAKNLFTVREAKFLLDKRYISVVPYKNTFGIFEELTV